jgi:hypothetical protein
MSPVACSLLLLRRIEAKLPPPREEERVIRLDLEDPAGPEHMVAIRFKAARWPA